MGTCAHVKDCLIIKADFTPVESKPPTSHKPIMKKQTQNEQSPKRDRNNNIKFSLDVTFPPQNPFFRPNARKHMSAKLNFKLNLDALVDAPRLTTQYLFNDQKGNNPTNTSGVKVMEYISDEQVDYVRKVLIDNNLVYNFDEDTIEEFVIGFFAIEVPEEHTLYEIGHDAKVFYIIEEGSVCITYSDGHIEELNKGSYFGLEAFDENDTAKRTASAKSKEKSRLLGVSGDFYRSALIYMDLKEMNEKVEIIKTLIIFKYIEQFKQIGLCKQLMMTTYKPNSIVINENEIQDRLFIIVKGRIRVTRKFKKIQMLSMGDSFGQIGLFMKLPCYYTYSVDKDEAVFYELQYSSIKSVLGNLCVKEILYKIFSKSIECSQTINDLIIQRQEELFNIFKLTYYEKGETVFLSDTTKNKKICVMITGELIKGQNNIVAKQGELYGHDIIDTKHNLDANIVSNDECLILEASWEEIIQASENYSNSISLSETVAKLKKIPIFSSLKETQYVELARRISIKAFKDNEIISREGEIANNFYIIKMGKVKMLRKGTFVRELDIGGCFGEIPNLTGEIRLFTVISVGASECYVLNKEAFALFDYHLCNQIKNFSSLNDVNITLQDLYHVKTLGNGRFGKVYLVHNQSHFYAIKYASIDTICRSKNLVKYYLNEKKIMLQIDHPFIVRLVKTLKTKDYVFFVRRNKDLFTESSDLENAYILRDNSKIPLNLQVILYDNEFVSGLSPEKYDTLIVPFKQSFITVAGAVNKPGRYPYIPDRTWEYYIGLAGGFDKTQNHGEVINIRDMNNRKVSKNGFITPESTITAVTNAPTYYFSIYAPVITTLLSTVSTIFTIIAVTR